MNAGDDERSPGAVGARVYSTWFLRMYDVGVLGFNNHVAWRCPTSRILEHYNEFMSGNHLEAASAPAGTWTTASSRSPIRGSD